MPNVHHLRHTLLPENLFVKGEPEKGAYLAEDLERIAANIGGENIAACIVEPIAGSTGSLVPPKGYLNKLREICDKHGILLIFDEVITGWGRTGEPFAAQAFDASPFLFIGVTGSEGLVFQSGNALLKRFWKMSILVFHDGGHGLLKCLKKRCFGFAAGFINGAKQSHYRLTVFGWPVIFFFGPS